MSSLQKIVVKSQFQNQLKPVFLNPICMQTFQNLPKIYGHIKIKKNHHKQKKQIYQQANHSSMQTSKNLQKQQTFSNKYFINNLKNKNQDSLFSKQQQFHRTLNQKKGSKSQDKFQNQLRCNLCQSNGGKISSNSFKSNRISQTNKRIMRKTSQINENSLIQNNKGCYCQQNQTNHKVKVNTQQKQISFLNKNKNKGLLSLIKQVSQKNQFNYNQRTKSQTLKTPGRSTHYRINSLQMQKIEELYLRKQEYNKLITKNKFRVNSKQVEKNIKITKNDILIKPIKRISFKKSLTQPNQKDQQLQYHQNQNKKHLNIKIIKEKKKNFHIPSKQQISHFLKNYKPILQNLNLNQIIKSQNFSIIYDDENLSLYAGQTKNQLKHGRGIKISKFSIFQGQFKNDFKKLGVQITKDGFYKGPFKNQKREGQGIFSWNNGQIFEGKWENNLKQGFGKWTSPKGDQYEGNWSLNKQNGYGIFKCNLSTYKGNFKEFLKHGKGQQYFKNGDKYIGQYKNGKPYGRGTYYWKDGQTYEGQFVNGLRQGQGILQTTSGQFYKGQFKNDFKHGKGFLKQFGKETLEGVFEYGKIIKANQF